MTESQSMIPLLTAGLFALLPIWSTAQAAPFKPSSDSTVLERLPFKPVDSVAKEIAELRSQLRRDPGNLDIAVRLANRYYDLVGEEGDPRYLGYAQAALAPWWSLATPPEDVQTLRAGIRQFQHDFAGAVSDLDQVIERNPRNTRAVSLRAIIHVVQARYPQAKTDCRALRQIGDPLIGLGCEAMVDGLTGSAGPAYERLSAELDKANPASIEPSKKMWVHLRLAELAQRMNNARDAEAHYRQALSQGINDTFLLAAFADFLLAESRPAEVVNLLKDKTRSDVLLLRLMFAERTMKLPSAKEREAALAARYAAARMRGESVHQQEEARFALYVEQDAKKALALAQENWKVQLEPRDAEILLDAALAVRDPVAARPVLQWIDETRIEDRRLLSLAQQVRGIRP